MARSRERHPTPAQADDSTVSMAAESGGGVSSFPSSTSSPPLSSSPSSFPPHPLHPSSSSPTSSVYPLKPISTSRAAAAAAAVTAAARPQAVWDSFDDDLDPDSTPALLRRHLRETDDEDNSRAAEASDPTTSDNNNIVDRGLLARAIAFMSKAPLLMRSAPGFGTGSYGVAPVGASTDGSDDEDGENYERKERLRKKQTHGKSGLDRTYSHDSVTSSKRSKSAGRRSEGGSSAPSIRLRSSTSKLRKQSLKSHTSETGNIIEEGNINGRQATGPLPIPNAETENGSGHESDSDDNHNTKDDESPSGSTSVDVDDNNGSDDEDPPDNSPYAQVRASVSAVDNITLSINTPRMWFLSLLFAMLGSSTNLFFSLRYPSVAITPVIALLLAHPLGLLWDQLLKRRNDPREVFVDGVLTHGLPSDDDDSDDASDGDVVDGANSASTGRQGKLRRLRLWLAQGRWNEKEHSCVYISSNVSFGFAFATDVIVEQTHFYKQDVGIMYQLLLTLSTQIIGYTFAGLTRRFLVRPGGMIWPGTLMSAAMFTTLHKEENKVADGWTISRWKFFFTVWVSSFVFYFLPGLLMPALSYFSVITWFAPKNVVIANLFGVASGLGLFPVTFDWAQIAYIGSPLLTPFWAAVNVVGGLVIVMWIVAPIAYYRNVFYSSYMPILSSAVFDNTGNIYDVSKILTKDFLFDKEAYRNYSRVYLPITYVLSYGLQFAALASLLTHTACWHGKDILRQWRRSLKELEGESKTSYQPLNDDRRGSTATSHSNYSNTSPRDQRRRSDPKIDNIMSQEDVHNRLMRRYRDAPLSWYLYTCISMTAIGIFVVEYYPIHLPWYGLLLALAICALLFIPIGIVMAITNQHSSIYLICQLVCGALFPGRPVANMVFVTYGYISSAQGIKFSADLKLGHYMKIPPRLLFGVQMAATVVSSLTQIAVLNWMFANVPAICTPQAINGFVCPIARVHFNGSILWGVVGPAEFFGRGATYRPLVWCFLVGAVAPVPLWLYARGRRHSLARKVNLPVLLGSLSWIPPATGLNFSVWALVCYLFNYLARRRVPAWWAKYTMTLSAALDSGLAFGLVVVFFGFVYPGWMEGFSWWGTEVYKRGCDWTACPYKVLPEGQRFGPDTW